MNKRILIVGGVAGGASVAARARRIDESAEIIMFEKGPNVSFSNCSLPFHLSGIVAHSESLVMMDPQQFKNQYNIEARVSSEVIKINRILLKIKSTRKATTSWFCPLERMPSFLEASKA
jgi:NADPH-dependent 2,4-dienoyl-CoA reductase/sulfur reductase-like enzyme